MKDSDDHQDELDGMKQRLQKQGNAYRIERFVTLERKMRMVECWCMTTDEE